MTKPSETILETERLLLRCLTSDDLDALAALYRDPDIRRYFPEGTLSVVRYAFETLQLPRLAYLLDGDDPENLASENRASIRVAEKLGMRLEQALDGIDGDGIPTLIFALERSS